MQYLVITFLIIFVLTALAIPYLITYYVFLNTDENKPYLQKKSGKTLLRLKSLMIAIIVLLIFVFIYSLAIGEILA